MGLVYGSILCRTYLHGPPVSNLAVVLCTLGACLGIGRFLKCRVLPLLSVWACTWLHLAWCSGSVCACLCYMANCCPSVSCSCDQLVCCVCIRNSGALKERLRPQITTLYRSTAGGIMHVQLSPRFECQTCREYLHAKKYTPSIAFDLIRTVASYQDQKTFMFAWGAVTGGCVSCIFSTTRCQYHACTRNRK